jgi:hypothetical protein
VKWSQAICASILIDGLYSIPVRPNPRRKRDFPVLPVDPAYTPNALAADWGVPEPRRAPVLNLVSYGILRRRSSGSRIES